jgi:hypothetical protein
MSNKLKYKIGDRVESEAGWFHIITEITDTEYHYRVYNEKGEYIRNYEYPIKRYEKKTFKFTKLHKAMK